MTEKFTCPRRIAEGHASPDSPLVMDGPNKDEWRDDRTCSYDGSIHPDDFMEHLRGGGKIEPTDKSYKFYVSAFDAKVRGAGKFYTHHLSEEQGWEFYDLWEARKINFAYPGHPYVSLYIPGPSTQQERPE